MFGMKYNDIKHLVSIFKLFSIISSWPLEKQRIFCKMLWQQHTFVYVNKAI